MTTRTRRNARQQTEAIWKKLLVKQEAEVDKRFAALQDAQAKLYKTRRVLAALGEEETPEESPRLVYSPRPLEGPGDDLSQPPNNVAEQPLTPAQKVTGTAMAEAIAKGIDQRVARFGGEASPVRAPRPHRQRIGEKRKDNLWDVWNAADGNVTVHSTLMYARQDACEWCKAGVPFATEERTYHHVTIAYSDGVERGFMQELCTGGGT